MKISLVLLLGLGFFALAEAQLFNRCGYRFRVITKAAGGAGGIRRTFSAFQGALGGIDNGNNAGPLPSGFRSINWDADVVPFDMPFNFFDKTVTRGAVFNAVQREFRVSNPNPPPPVDNRFSSLLPISVTSQFKTFSPKRLFTPYVKNFVTQTFKVPATNRRGSVSGFGAVFTDVDIRKATWIEFYTKTGCLLARVNVPPRNRGLSFAGLYTIGRKPVIWRVAIKLGTISVKQAGRSYSGPGDVVVLDDLLYGEPQPQRRGGRGY